MQYFHSHGHIVSGDVSFGKCGRCLMCLPRVTKVHVSLSWIIRQQYFPLSDSVTLPTVSEAFPLLSSSMGMDNLSLQIIGLPSLNL